MSAPLHPRDYWSKLFCLYSFVKADDIQNDNLCQTLLAGDEYLIGAYINTVDDLILFSTDGLYWVKESIARSFPYSAIITVDLPEDSQHRQLKLLLADGTMVHLSIANDTEDVPDILNIYDFLKAEIYYPFTGWNNELPIESVSSPADLAAFLGELGHGGMETIIALRERRPTERQMRMFGIDPAILDRPDTWRLIAAFMSIPQRKRQFQSSAQEV